MLKLPYQRLAEGTFALRSKLMAYRITKLLPVFFALAVALVGAENSIGTIKSVQGAAIIRRGTQSMTVNEGMHLELNDVIQSSGDCRLGMMLQDGTRISLGPNAELRLDQFVYQPSDGKFALLLKLGRGALAYISGRIAQLSPASVSVETPVGVIGLRGTRFVVSLEGV